MCLVVPVESGWGYGVRYSGEMELCIGNESTYSGPLNDSYRRRLGRIRATLLVVWKNPSGPITRKLKDRPKEAESVRPPSDPGLARIVG